MLLHDDRLRAVGRAEAVLLDRDADLRRLSALAARQLDVDIAFLSMVSHSEERLYAVHRDDGGDAPASMPVEQSLCRYLVEEDAPLFVRDLHHDPRLSHLAEVRALGLRAYAGVPVRDRSGLVLGGLCVAHGRPRAWRTTDQELLEDLSGVIGTELDLRIALADVERLADAATSSALEQRTLHEVTAAFAANRPLPDVLGLLVAGLVRAQDISCALVVRLHGDGRAEALASADTVEDALARSLPALAEVRAGEPAPARLELGGTLLHAVPVVVEGRLWGALVSEGPPGPDRVLHLQHLADAVALGLSQVRAREDLVHLAATDPLTGAANRRTFEVRLADELQRSRRHEHPLTLVLLDLDDFKTVNDQYGHVRGDRLLQELSAHLQAQLRAEDLLARVGGDEFALLLPETGREAAAGTVERLRASVASTSLAQLKVTLTAGSCCSQHGGASPAALYRCADRALYDGKAGGRNLSVAVETA